MTHYDFIIIGAGIAGMYSAYNIKKLYPDKSFLILEKNTEHGGRAVMDHFYGVEVTPGAGIGRKRSDALLIKLMNELKFKYTEFKTTVDHQGVPAVNIMKVISRLRREYTKHPELRQKTFKEFFQIFDKKLYGDFVSSTGYTDYENADVHDVLYDYTMQDIVPGWTGLYISWAGLLDKLYRHIGGQHFKFSTEVRQIKVVGNKFEVAAGLTVYGADKIIIATTISGILKLVPLAIYRQIHQQPFLRVYAKFNAESADIMRQFKHYTIIKRPLQKIIPINPDKGIYMIAYSDNQSATRLKKYIQNTPANQAVFSALLEEVCGAKLKITAIKAYYWLTGTHYYEPLRGAFKNRAAFIREAQRPQKNIFVVGEVVSEHQGWVEGALESVAAVKNSF
jgi:monoamine oxidase